MRALVVVIVMLGACNGSGDGRRRIPDAVLARPAISYSGYRAGQGPDVHVYPSEAQIDEDLELLVHDGYGFLRLFDAGTHAERVLSVIRQQHLDLKVQQGIWIAGGRAEHDAENRAELERGVALAAAYPDLIVAVSVGNETLDDWSSVKTPAADLAAYLQEVRGRVSVPVTTDDMYLPLLLGSDGTASYAGDGAVVRAVDYLSVHVYAFLDAYYQSWAWKQDGVPADRRADAMMSAAFDYTRASVRAVRAEMTTQGLDLPIILGESGWKSATSFTAADEPEHAIEVYLAAPRNQQIFDDAVKRWVYGPDRDADSPVAAFTFEAFDEPWKGGDDHWGLYDVDRARKQVSGEAVYYTAPAPTPAR